MNRPAQSEHMVIGSSCVVCGRTVPKKYLRRADGSQVAVCRCGLGYLDPFPTEEQVRKLYNRDYFTGGSSGIGYTKYFEDSYAAAADPASFSNVVASELDRRIGLPGQSLLDVGCATGIFLQAARMRGAKVTGVELSDAAAQTGRDLFALEIHTGYLEELPLSEPPFDIISMIEVIEHPRHPRALLSAAHRVCRPGGHLILTTPNFGMERYYGGRYRGFLNSFEHLYYWTEPTLRRVLEEEGFEVVTCEGLNRRFIEPYKSESRVRHLVRKVIAPLVRIAPRDISATSLLLFAKRKEQ